MLFFDFKNDNKPTLLGFAKTCLFSVKARFKNSIKNKPPHVFFAWMVYNLVK